MPMPAASLASFTSSSMERRYWPGIGADRLAHAAAVHDEERVDEVVDGQRGLAHHLAQQRLLAQPSRTERSPCGHHALLLRAGGRRRAGLRAK